MAHQQHGPKEAGGFQNVILSTQQQLMNPGEAGKRKGQQVDLPLRKPGREHRCRSYTPGQACWVTMGTHVHPNVFKVFLWRLCRKSVMEYNTQI